MADSTQKLFSSIEVAETQSIKDVLVPTTVAFRQIVVTGPPCSGKSKLVEKLGGWPEEGYIDLAINKWWQNRIFTFRPREIHFGFPCAGFKDSHAVFDREWLQSPTEVEFTRVQLPPGKRGFFSVDWRNRYAFDFQLLPAEQIFNILQDRRIRDTHHIDAELTLDRVQRGVDAYVELAKFFHENGILVYFRDRFDGRPRSIVTSAPENLD